MNEKFWDLKKSKQDSMINGSLKVFSRYGFRHASTDEIVVEAGISKGLLFHYFYSKSGLYEFLSEYSARFALVELNSEIRKVRAIPARKGRQGAEAAKIRKAEAVPYFDLQRKFTDAESAIMRQYPYMLLFLERAQAERGLQDREEILSNIELYTSRRANLLESVVLPAKLPAEDAVRISRFLDLARFDCTYRLIEAGGFVAEEYMNKMESDIQFFAQKYK